MRIGRTLPPAASPITLVDIAHGIWGTINQRGAINRFSAVISSHFKVDNPVFLSSGTAALAIILEALHEICPDKCEVILPAFTCNTLPSAVVRAGLKITLCDIDATTLDYDYAAMKKCIDSSSSILAIVAPHLFGLPADIARLKELVKNRGITIIEDAAQAIGTIAHGQKLGTIGDVGFFSLARGKAFSTYEGGIIISQNKKLLSEINTAVAKLPTYSLLSIIKLWIQSLIVAFFLNPTLFWFPKSLPFLKFGITPFDPDFPMMKMSGFQAGLAHSFEKKLHRFKQKRGMNCALLNTLLDEKYKALVCGKLEEGSPIRYPVLLDSDKEKEQLVTLSEKKGLGISVTYSTITDIPHTNKEESFPGAEKCARGLVALPVHSMVTERDGKVISHFLQSTVPMMDIVQ